MNKARLVVAAIIFGAVAVVVNGCNSTYWDGVKRRVSRMANFDTNKNQLTLKCDHGDEEACLTYAKFADVFNQCNFWKSGIACAEYGKINYDINGTNRRVIKIVNKDNNDSTITIEKWFGKSKVMGIDETSYIIKMPTNKEIEYSIFEVKEVSINET